jgi:hypothetical protein
MVNQQSDNLLWLALPRVTEHGKQIMSYRLSPEAPFPA